MGGNPIVRLPAGAAIALFLFATPKEARAADDGAAVPVVQAVSQKQIRQFLDKWRTAVISVRALDGKGAPDAAAIGAAAGFLSQVALGNGKKEEDSSNGPSRERIDSTTVNLPFAFPWGPNERSFEHVILYDATGQDEWFSALWEKQSGALRDKLKSLGVAPERIHVRPVRRREDFAEALAQGGDAAKKVYAFGHADPLVMYFGDESVSMTENAQLLRGQRVEVVTHFGCSFVNLGAEDLRPLQERLGPGARITLFGHRLPSDTEDDSPWNSENPIVRLVVRPDAASMHLPNDELAGKAGALASLLGAPAMGPIPAAVGAGARWHAAETVGRPPERAPEPPS